jgi:hypothetical protein
MFESLGGTAMKKKFMIIFILSSGQEGRLMARLARNRLTEFHVPFVEIAPIYPGWIEENIDSLLKKNPHLEEIILVVCDDQERLQMAIDAAKKSQKTSVWLGSIDALVASIRVMAEHL